MRRKRRFRSVVFAVLFFVVLIILINAFVFRSSIQSTAYLIWQNPGAMLERFVLRVGGLVRGVSNIEEIITENDQLRSQERDAIAREGMIETLQQENQLLRRQLGVNARLPRRTLLGHIFHIERSPLGSVIFIDRGRSDEVKEKMAVIGPGNVLYGFVSELFSGSAKITLLDDPQSTISVRVLGKNIQANLKGTLHDAKGTATLDLVTSKDEIAEGDQLVTSGLDGLSEGLIIGKVASVNHVGGNLFQAVSVDLSFEPIESNQIFIILQ